MTNTKDATTRTLSDTAPSNAEDVEIEFLQHLARTIARAEKLNNDVEELWRKRHLSSKSLKRRFWKFMKKLHDWPCSLSHPSSVSKMLRLDVSASAC